MSQKKSVGVNKKYMSCKINVGLVLCALLMGGCTASITTHQFQYYGTDALLSGRDFEYVRFGLKGKSYTSYSVYRKVGGAVRDGMVADAKRNLRSQYELGPNEAYSNVSIDVLTTRSGPMSAGGLKENKVALTVVITADVVRLGGAVGPSNRDWTVGGSLGSLPEVDKLELDGAISKAPEPEQEEFNPSEVAPEQDSWNQRIGDTVFLVVKKVACSGVITKFDDGFYGVKVSIGGKTRYRWVRPKKLYRTMEEAQAAAGNQGE